MHSAPSGDRLIRQVPVCVFVVAKRLQPVPFSVLVVNGVFKILDGSIFGLHPEKFPKGLSLSVSSCRRNIILIHGNFHFSKHYCTRCARIGDLRILWNLLVRRDLFDFLAVISRPVRFCQFDFYLACRKHICRILHICHIRPCAAKGRCKANSDSGNSCKNLCAEIMQMRAKPRPDIAFGVSRKLPRACRAGFMTLFLHCFSLLSIQFRSSYRHIIPIITSFVPCAFIRAKELRKTRRFSHKNKRVCPRIIPKTDSLCVN